VAEFDPVAGRHRAALLVHHDDMRRLNCIAVEVAKAFSSGFASCMSRRRSRPAVPLSTLPPREAGGHVRKDGAGIAQGFADDHDGRMRHILHSMVVDGHARQVVQAYLRAMRAGENAEQTAVNLIGKLRPGLTLAEPAEMLERLLAWIAAEHGEWWHKALARRRPSLSVVTCDCLLSPRSARGRGRRKASP
jgi:hypothetical protein